MARPRVLEEALESVKRFSGYALLSLLPVERLRWLGGRGVQKELLTKLGFNCVLDVGANHGQFGMALRRMGYKGWIFSFEPIKANCEILENSAKGDSRWRVFPYALGASNGKLAIHVSELSAFSSFLPLEEESLKKFPDSRVARTEEVEVRRLDDIIGSCVEGIESPRIYLKLDTQGFDLEVMKGAEGALQNIVALQTEVSFRSIYSGMPGYMESIKEFEARGFDVVDLVPVISDADGLRVVEMDCFMAKRAA